jgi:hypothetical protein
VLYRLRELIEDIAQEHPIFIVEGEKDVIACRDRGIPATCNSMGAATGDNPEKTWRPEYNETLRGADVIICGDNDDPGREHVQFLAKNLYGIAKRVRVLDLKHFWPEIEESDDITDWFDAGHTVEQLWEIVGRLVDYMPGSYERREPDPPWELEPEPTRKLIQSSAEFVADFKPPDYLLDGVLQRRFIYSLTGLTGSGKTSVMLMIAASVALGRSIGSLEVDQGRVLYCAGENPDDVRMRWIALSKEMDFYLGHIDVHFITERGNITQLRRRIDQELAQIGDVALVVIDTAQAYFPGDDINDNVQALAYAVLLRKMLIDLRGGPAVAVCCHPVKRASRDNLIPYGAGAFINEMDGNLTCWKDDQIAEVHWQGKHRGPDFAPLPFMLKVTTHERLIDKKGRAIKTVVASFLSDAEKQTLEHVARTDEDKMLLAIKINASATLGDYARICEWFSASGDAYKMKVKRAIDRLIDFKLITKERDGYAITAKGHAVIKKLEFDTRDTEDTRDMFGKRDTKRHTRTAAPPRQAVRLESKTAPTGAVCVRCFKATPENHHPVKLFRNAATVGSKYEPLHLDCAQEWFEANL